MMRRTFAGLAAFLLVLTGAPLGYAANPEMTDYTASPPFITSTTTPNILIIMDNSGSMEARACEATSCGVLPDGTTSTSVTFLNTTKYTGFLDSMNCYSYDVTDNRFGETVTTKASLSANCAATEWDGNFINWATFRRFDAVKKALHGGDCNTTRAVDGTCPPSGTPALITIRAQKKFMTTNSGHFTSPFPLTPLP